eukprot:Nitzschia sp. Nitz4//scaffold25_size161228//15469//16458//NITZ4_002413-RA/size161228-augustus-gene-0.122-mRNA-1//-1//CDS//3329544535//4546//frame0
MTNKNKKMAVKKDKKEEVSDPFSGGVPEPQMQNMTRAQLAGFTFACIGVTKLMEFSTALSEGTEDPQKCLDYLGQENMDTCTHPAFQALIQAKFYSGLNLAAVVITTGILLWASELTFLKFINSLTFSPVATTTVASIISPFLESKHVWNFIVIATVMFATSAPQNDHQLAFWHVEHPYSLKSFQAVSFMAMGAYTVWEIASLFLDPQVSIANALIQSDTPLPDAASTLVNFLIVDKISMLVLYAFSVVHLPNHTQRAVLFMLALTKLAEYFYQFPNMTHSFQSQDIVQTAAIGSAILAGAGWAAP